MPRPDFKQPLENLARVQADTMPVRYVAFIDMLGFSALTKEYPGTFYLHVMPEQNQFLTITSPSSSFLERFHKILNKIAAEHVQKYGLERMMIFSDCAFTVYSNAVHAALSLCEAMRSFLNAPPVAVRLCLAKGTFHDGPFTVETSEACTVTRAMFFGTGVVSAVEGERKAGKGCRIFLHASIDDNDLEAINARVRTLALTKPTPHATHELNYLHESPDPEALPARMDGMLHHFLCELLGRTRPQDNAPVLAHHAASFAAFNAMRAQLHRGPIQLPHPFEHGRLHDFL